MSPKRFSFRKANLAALWSLLLFSFIFSPVAEARDPHPRKTRTKNESGNITWATPLIYGSLYGEVRLRDKLSAGDVQRFCTDRNWACDCQFEPKGPIGTWIQIQRGYNPKGYQCYAPPYSADPNNAWWQWYKSEIERIRNSLTIGLDQIPALGVRLGIDGEGRPLKSGDGWAPELLSEFRTGYVPAVIGEVHRLYPGKNIRAMTESNFLGLYLENDIDFHRESLASDEIHAYLYEGLQWNAMGWWQGYADHFWVTNTLGLGQGWPPIYQTVLSALAKHTDSMTGGLDVGGGGMTADFVNWAKSYMGKDINDTPGTWIYLRDTMIRKKEWVPDPSRHPQCGDTEHLYESFALNFSGKYGDYDFYLYRPEELEKNQTVPVKANELPYATVDQMYTYQVTRSLWVSPKDANCNVLPGKTVTFTQYVGRKVAPGNRYMSFDIDDGYIARFAGQQGVSYEVRIVFLDQGTGSFKFQFKNKDDQWQSKTIYQKATNRWVEAKFNLADAYFNNNASEGSNASLYPTDFRLDFGLPGAPAVIHLIEVRAKGGIAVEEKRPKAQVSCDVIRNKNDEPKKGIYTLGLNQSFWVKGTLKDPQGNPIPNQRIIFTYNTEWNLAKSAMTDAQGNAYAQFSTANNPKSSGFLGKDSSYSIQAYFAGSDAYQPSRNDARIWISDSPSPTDPRNSRMEITQISAVGNDGKVGVSYKLYNTANQLIGSGGTWVGKTQGFYADDPNSQTVTLYAAPANHFPTFNSVTLKGISNGVPRAVKNLQASTIAGQGKVTLTWDPNPEPNVTGYRVYYGTEPGNFSKVLGISGTNTATVTGLVPNTTYYFAVSAYNLKAYEGPRSKETSKTAGQVNHKLIVHRWGEGSGTVKGEGINCGSACEGMLAPGKTVTLTAAANADSTFDVWGGDCSGKGPCTITMDANKTVIARFRSISNPPPPPPGESFTITASVSVGVGGTIVPSGTVSLAAGGSKTFNMNPGSGYYLADVKIDGSSIGAVSSYTFRNVIANHRIEAAFNILGGNQYSLTVFKGGNGVGILNQSPSGAVFNAGTIVTLTARAESGSIFEGWSGACSGKSETCTVTMNGNQTITADFSPLALERRVTSSQKGTVVDLDGDGRDDVVWFDADTRHTMGWLISNSRMTIQDLNRNVDEANWKMAGGGNLSGDGSYSIFWHNEGTGKVYAWFMNRGVYLGEQYIRTVEDLQWKMVGVGDFDGDGNVDLLWHHQGNGAVYIWFMKGLNFISDQPVATIEDVRWQVIGVGDWNGDKKADLLWQHPEGGPIYIWFMDGARVLGDQYVRGVEDLNWKVIGIGRFSDSKEANILWRHEVSGETYIWYLEGGQYIGDAKIQQ